MDLNSNWKAEPRELEDIAVAYFQQLFQSSQPTAIDDVIKLVESVVTPAMNIDLMQHVSTEEIKRALFQMHQSKSPRPNGMIALFFQKYWHIVGVDVIEAVLDFLNNGRMLGSINFTTIVLIPKVKAPTNMSQFRPISLCNVLYKIISKVLINRMKSMPSRVISDCQSAFVPRRMITDNVIVSFEMLHYLKNKRGGKDAHDGGQA